MKNISILLFFTFFTFASFAQENNTPDKEVVEYHIVRQEIEKNPNDALKKIINYENNVATKKGEGLTQLLYGMYYYFTDNSALSDSSFNKAADIFESINDKKGVVNAKSNLAIIQQVRGDFKNAIQTYYSNLPYFFELKDTLNIGTTYNNIATIFMMEKNYKKAKTHYKKALRFYLMCNNYDGQGLVLSKLGSIEFNNLNFNIAEQYFKKSIQTYEKINDSLGIADAFIKIGDVWFERDKNISAAFNKYKQADEIYNRIGANCNSAFTKKAMGDCKYETKEYKKAKEYYLNAMKILEQCNYNYALPESYQKLAVVEEKINAINDIDTKYKTAEKDKVILQKEVDLLSKNKKIETQKTQFLIITVILFVIITFLIFGFYFYRKQKNLNDKLSKLNRFKSQIFTIIGHDLRSPISSIVMSAENETTKTKANKALNILDNLLMWGKLNEKNLNVDKHLIFFETIIDELMDEMSNEIANKNIKVTQNFNNCKPFNANKNEITVVLRNLFDNAIKYNIKNGSLNLQCDNNVFIIENTYDKNIESGSKIGLEIVENLCIKNNCSFTFFKDKLAKSKIIIND